jgi:hypothetical protein
MDEDIHIRASEAMEFSKQNLIQLGVRDFGAGIVSDRQIYSLATVRACRRIVYPDDIFGLSVVININPGRSGKGGHTPETVSRQVIEQVRPPVADISDTARKHCRANGAFLSRNGFGFLILSSLKPAHADKFSVLGESPKQA